MTDHGAIPYELKTRDRWLVWRFVERNGKITKTPFQAASPDHHANITNPAHLSSYEVAVRACQADESLGLGFALGDGVVGIDLDDCLNQIETPLPWAKTILDRVPTYTEVSPSGKGLHLLAISEEPCGSIRVGGIEVYDHDRYFTVTGVPFRDNLMTDRTKELKSLVADLSLVHSMLQTPPKIIDLWEGKTPEDQSAGDYALAIRLLRFLGGDRQTADRLFRLSGRMRSKWNELRGSRTYGSMTLEKAAEAIAEELAVPRPEVSLERIQDLYASPPVPPKMLVRNLLADGTITVLGGVSGAGKSLALLDIALSVAAGVPAFGNDQMSVAEARPVIYLYGEQDPALWFHRAAGVIALRGLPHDLPFSFARLTVPASITAGGIDALIETVRREKAGLVILDSITALFSLSSQDDAAEVARSVRGPLQRLVSETGATVVAVHHARKDTRSEKPPQSAADCIRGSDEFIALASGGIVGVWKSMKTPTIPSLVKVLVTLRAWGEFEPFALEFVTPPGIEQDEVALESPPVSVLQWKGWWCDLEALREFNSTGAGAGGPQAWKRRQHDEAEARVDAAIATLISLGDGGRAVLTMEDMIEATGLSRTTFYDRVRPRLGNSLQPQGTRPQTYRIVPPDPEGDR